MTITETQKDYEITFPYDFFKVKALKEIPGAWYRANNKSWHVPKHLTHEVNRLRQKFHVTELRQEEPEKQIYETIPELPDLETEIPTLKRKLFPFQEKGTAYCIANKRVIIGDQPGLGKTSQCIAALEATKAFPALIICPSSLKLNWRKEWTDVSGRRSMILTDAVKNTWQQYYNVGMIDVFIVNYESLKKFFVKPGWSKPKEGQFRMNMIPFIEKINIFKSVVIDESHKCFPFDTKVLTNKGWFKIGEIVENKLTNLLVASVNLSDFTVSLKPITNTWKNGLNERKIYRIRHNKGWFCATEDHKIYTASGRYKKVCEIKSGDDLYLLRKEFLDDKSWQDHSEVLLKKLCGENNKCEPGNTAKDGQKQKTTTHRKNLRVVRHLVFNDKTSVRSYKKILQPELQRQMETDTAGIYCSKSKSKKEREVTYKSDGNNGFSRAEEISFGDDEKKQSNVIRGHKNKSFRKTKGQTFSNTEGRKWTINKAATVIERSSELISCKYGISNRYNFIKRRLSRNPSLLQTRYRYTRNKISYRGRRNFSQSLQSKSSGCFKNKNIELVRVESIEIYQQGNINQSSRGPQSNQFVYDLEIADNHNYFADGILVSNCKDGSTQQSKFVMGICSGKEYVYELTGTPVVNNPKDLITQLHIIDRLREVVDHIPRAKDKHGNLTDFGGYNRFVNRYCGGGNGATNLEELNYRLNKLCFFRREKSEVLKDLPAKMRQVVLCDISNRNEYSQAEKEFVNYLKEVRGCTDAEVKKKLRGEVMVKMGILKQISARGKMDAVKDHIDEIVDSGEKVVVFCSLREIGDSLKAAYPGAAMIRGGMTDEEKNTSVNRFQKDAGTKVIICSIKAAGVGLTLTASSRVVFVEFPWTFADCEQCEDRTHRIGQEDSVQCAYMLGEDTIDRYCYELIQKKKKISQTITGALDDVAEEIIDDLLNLFNQK